MEHDLDLDAFDFFELGVDVVDAADQGPQLGDGQRRGRIGLHRNRNNFVPADLELILKHEGVPGLTQTPELKINRAPRPKLRLQLKRSLNWRQYLELLRFNKGTAVGIWQRNEQKNSL